MSFQSTFMDALKLRYLEVIGDRCFGGSASKTQAPYYLKDLNDNLVIAMSSEHRERYSEGDGNELETKMRSLRSSSAMTFNLLGDTPVAITENPFLPSGEYQVTFEYQLPTLANNSKKANLDAFLISEEGKTEIYCEMKLAEWILGKASGLRYPYLDAANYLIPENAALKFVSAFGDLSTEARDTSNRIAPKLYRYDAFQMLKHLLAIYSNCYQRRISGESLPSHLHLVNCVWEMANPEKLGCYQGRYLSMLSEEHEQYEILRETVEPICMLFANLDICFTLEYIPFSDFLSCLSLHKEHARKLQRYIV